MAEKYRVLCALVPLPDGGIPAAWLKEFPKTTFFASDRIEGRLADIDTALVDAASALRRRIEIDGWPATDAPVSEDEDG